MTTINCNLCGSSSKKTVLVKEKFNIVMCKKCGFVYTDKLNHVYDSIYGEGYFHIEDFKNIKYGYRSYEKDREHHKYYFEKKLDFIHKYLPSGKVLDVGCALGFFLEVAEERGYEPYGIDVSQYATSYALKNFPENVFCGTFAKAKFKANFFDGLTLFQTLEHLENPLDTLLEARRILKQNGYLIIATPNHNCIMRKIMGRYWFEYKPKEHLNFFDEESIKLFLEKTGFKLMEIKDDIFYYPVDYILERISYYSPFKILNKIAVYFNSVANIRIPLPLGGMILAAKKI